MTREEAIEILENGGWWDLLIPVTTIEGRIEDDKLQEALDLAISALRPVRWERVEKVFHGCPECKSRCGLCIHMGAWDKYGKPYVCEQCVDCSNFKSDQRFCEVCGAPMSDEAVQMVMEKMEALHGET